MNSKAIVSVLMVALLGLSQAGAFAQPGKGNNGRNGNNSHCGNGDQGCEREQSRGNQGRDNNGRGEQGSNRSDSERGAGPSHAYYRGDHMPYGDRGRQYVVDDWRGHGLRSPPRGYHWVQSGGDYILVAIATGVILDLLLSR